VRREERTALDEPARLHPNSWSSLEVRVLDLSPGGFKAECDARVTVGSSVTLEAPGVGPLYATVTWRRGDRFGARFTAPVDLAACGWSPVSEEERLARMLVERAHARRSGAFGAELELRRKILAGLPMRRGQKAEAAKG
jgi:hypothetical protein